MVSSGSGDETRASGRKSCTVRKFLGNFTRHTRTVSSSSPTVLPAFLPLGSKENQSSLYRPKQQAQSSLA